MKDLAASCMLVEAVGEGFKNIDKLTDGTLLQENVTFLKIENASLHDRVTTLENALAELKKKIEKLDVTPEPSVTFENITVDDKTYKLGTSGAVELGLSVKWAACNVGATLPGDYGDYFAWGETVTKSTYNWGTYTDSPNRDGYSFTKYAKDKELLLDYEDDAANVKLNGDWRMPTDEELTELRTKCIWIWTQYGGHNGYVVAGSADNAIFLPAAGCHDGNYLYAANAGGNYWSSSIRDDPYSHSDCAYEVSFTSEKVSRNGFNRYYGFSVRPVLPN